MKVKVDYKFKNQEKISIKSIKNLEKFKMSCRTMLGPQFEKDISACALKLGAAKQA